MKQQEVVPLYAHLQYDVLHKLEITISEYWYLDMIYQLSRDKWCYKSLDNIANDMRMTKNGVVKMRDRLTGRGFIVKGRAGKVRTSGKYNSVYFSASTKYNSVTNRTTEYTSGVQLSCTKINNKINKEISEAGEERTSSNKERIRAALKNRNLKALRANNG